MRHWLSQLGRSLLLIFVVALCLRCAFLFHQARLIPAEVLAAVPFQNEVGNVADSLAHGQGFCCLFRQSTGPTAWLAPVYPLLIAAIFKLFGSFTVASFYAAALMNSLFSALACFPLFYAGKRIAGVSVAAAACWVWAIFPSGVMMPFEWIWDTSLSALLAAALLWATLYVADSRRARDFALYGLLWGVSLLTNPSLGALLPFLLGWILFRRFRGGSFRLTPLVIIFAVLFACCLPWTIRNAVQFHRLIPVRANFPYELWSGNNEIFDEHSRAVNRITRYEQTRRYAQLGENAFLDEKWQKATEFIRTHPALYAQLFGRRIVATWLGTESPWQLFSQSGSLLVRGILLWNAITLLGTIVGLLRLSAARNPFFLPVAVFPLVFPITFYISHTSLRHRHPCDPIIALLVAIAVLGGRLAQGERVSPGTSAGVLT
ncbi:MAG TPA: glycosyltransferase family 39 protein [Candidatus Acidoferrum sp.]|nr:glycosyltransferase family 39 protein [Candidatus Acidoferrum sp.]